MTDHHGNVTSMSYDLLGRKTAMVDPDMGAWQYQYDAAGNLTAQRDGRGQWLHLGYDSLNRLTAKRRDAVDGPLLAAYVYDTVALGQLYAAQAYAGAGNVQVETRTTALDDRYRATAQEWIVAGQGTFRMATAYNAADQVTSLTYPADNAGNLGEVVVQGYNSIGRLTNVTGHLPGGATEAYVASALYNARGQLTALASGNGLTRQYDYAPDTLRLTHIRAGMTAPWTDLQSLSYTYDASGNILTLTDSANAGQVQSFGYDWLDRLVSAGTNAAGTGQYSHTYAYDAIGNITNFAGSAYVYSATQPHAVVSAHGNTYAYDANGNQTARTIADVPYAMTFDAENRLTAVTGGSTSASFVYDAAGSRIMGTVDGVTTVYIGGIYEWQAGASTAYYAGPDGAVAFRRSGYSSDNGVYYLLRDHLGSSSVIVDGSGNAVKREFYYPFGGNRGSAFSDLTSKRFTGQYHEDGLPGGEGLSYYNARWYDAQLGRFVSADTIVPNPVNPQDLNRLAYARNNPVRFSDPTGHYVFEESPDDAYVTPPTSRRSATRSSTEKSHRQVSRSGRIYTAYLPTYGVQPRHRPIAGAGLSASWNPCPGHFLCQAQQEMPYGGASGSAPRSATPSSGPWLSPGSTPTPTPGTYLGQGQPLPVTATPRPVVLEGPELRDVFSGLYGEITENGLDLVFENLGFNASSVRMFGRTLGAIPTPPTMAIGYALTVGPNMVENIRSGHGFDSPRFYADFATDSLGYGFTTVAGWVGAGAGGIAFGGNPMAIAAGDIAVSAGAGILWDVRFAPYISVRIESALARP